MIIAFPNSYNISLFLLRVKTAADALGNQSMRLVGSKEVGGIISSISSKEYKTSLENKIKFDFKISIQAFLYDGSKYVYIKREDKVFRIERTYLNGMFLELYLIETQIKYEDLLYEDN
jgi:hypothetical protein